MSTSTPTTLATWVYSIHRALEHDGIDSTSILSELGLDLNELPQSAKVPKAAVNLLWYKAIQVTTNDAFSLRVLYFINDPALNVLIASVQASADIRQALAVMLKYYKLISSGTRISLEVDDEVRLVVSDATEEPYLIPEDVDLVFGLIRRFGCMLPRNEIRPTRLFLTRPRPARAADYEHFFECEVHFDAPRNVLAFPLDIMCADIPGKNSALSEHVERFLASSMERQEDVSIKDRLISAMVVLMPGGTPKLPEVAKRLHMSTRTLQRKLQAEELCFQTLLNSVRLDLAKKHLKEGQLSIQEISYRVGFAECGNFIRFFKQHCGVRPSEFEPDQSVG
jgi:AraC-like DNA-binding protein